MTLRQLLARNDAEAGEAWHIRNFARVRRACDEISEREGEQCTVPKCKRNALSGYRRKLCGAHRRRLDKYGDVQADKPLRNVGHPSKTGGRKVVKV